LLHEGELQVLFTRRTETLRSHAGQISFPGGARDPEDATPEHAALRETHEELGVAPDSVRVLGSLDEIPTVTGFRIQPFVGLLAAEVAFVPNPAEIAEVLVIPWRHLENPAHMRTERREVWGREVDTYLFEWNHHVIWGATAHILHDLLRHARGLPAFSSRAHS
jgi:8-oxo-dGTP pyrophosphatase MutT (NUDIX family)